MKTNVTGNGRESFAHLPMQNDKYICSGKHDPGEVLESLEKEFMQ